MTTAAIEIAGLRKQLGAFTLGPIDISVPSGAIYALIGANGAGKTTTLDMIAGLVQSDSGSVRVLGLDPAADGAAVKRRIAYVTPDLNYEPWGTVSRALAFLSGFYSDWSQDRCNRLLAEFSLYPDEKITSLSFGSRTKLAIIAALSRDPELLVLDEPTVGLDPVSRRQLFTELQAFMQVGGRTILISSHQLSDLERFADHVALMNEGRFVEKERMDGLIGKYSVVSARVMNEDALRSSALRILKREGCEIHLLIDNAQFSSGSLEHLGVQFIRELPMTLDDVFYALIGSTYAESKLRNTKAR